MSGSVFRARSILGILLLLAGSLVGAGVLQLVFVFGTDAALQELARGEVPELRRVQEITRSSSEVHRHMLGTLLDEAPDENRHSRERCALAMAETERLLGAPGGNGKFKDEEKTVRGLWMTYQKNVAVLIDALETGRKAEALKLRRDVVRPSYEDLRVGLADWSAVVEASARESVVASSASLRLRHMLLLVFCAWPLAVALIGLLVLAGYWLYAATRLPDDSEILPR